MVQILMDLNILELYMVTKVFPMLKTGSTLCKMIGILDHPTFVKTLLENLMELFVTAAGY